ncbi:AP endonuclease, family 2 [Streptomyces griseoflavus Tu4000]|uniref:AP endonuclease, family 2 n=1 Tax=Streptomyces griseoflavus Tu4000 TaxID=467200 RepID=D9XZB8_9ACTN|nr:AP endonuclease, family 2 [Streptomyces griseoflavus Tu4000]
MKLAFSTLGVPGLPLNDVLALATAHGYHGVELRAHPEEPVHPGLTPAQRSDVVAAFKGSGVELLGLAGYARVAAPGEDEPVLTEIRALLDLARDLGAPFVRVFPGGGTEQSPEEADATAARRLGTAAEYAADLDVRILLETQRLAPHRSRRHADPRPGRPPAGRRAVGRDAHLGRRRAARGELRGALPAPRLRPGEGHRLRRRDGPAPTRRRCPPAERRRGGPLPARLGRLAVLGVREALVRGRRPASRPPHARP